MLKASYSSVTTDITNEAVRVPSLVHGLHPQVISRDLLTAGKAGGTKAVGKAILENEKEKGELSKHSQKQKGIRNTRPSMRNRPDRKAGYSPY